LAVVALPALFALLPPARLGLAAAPAKQEAALEQMVEINRKALDELRAGRNEAARDDLMRALAIGKRAALGGHQMMARSYLHLGAVYLTGFGDRSRALRQLVTAVKIRPSIQITPELLTPSLQEAFEAARAQVPGASPPKPPVGVEGNEGGAPSATKSASPPTSLQNPFSATHQAEPPPPRGPTPAAQTVPSERRSPQPEPGRVAASEPDPAPSVDPFAGGPPPAAVAEVTRSVPTTEPARRLWIGFGVGSGFGWHDRRDLEAQPDFFIPSGVATAALVHLSPEVGYRWDARTAFSLQSRHQLIPVTGTLVGGVSRARMAHALFLRAHRLLAPVGDDLELWGTAAVGAGSAIRFYIPQHPMSGLEASDTVAAGPFAFGPGVSLVYRASPRLGILAEVRAMVAVWRVAALADLGVGALYSF
jgi:hypothetical protein